ncbi:site-specific integrase [Chryseolinea sp. T2]|uniref:site-specific integrase n=1 Tax=Chryseolinea sp. T2 TaxID=3129255 RepID=UPI003076A13F
MKFFLESKSKEIDQNDKPLPIFLIVRKRGFAQIKTYVERKCPRAAWDVGKGRVTPRKFKLDPTGLNFYLERIQKKVSRLCEDALEEGRSIPSKVEVRAIINKENGNEVDDRQSVLQFANEFLAKSTYAPNTKKSYQTTINLLQKFVDEKLKGKLKFEAINLDFHDKFTEYMWTTKKFNDNTVGKHIKNLKSIMSESFERGMHTSLDFKKSRFKAFSNDVDNIYLDEKELEAMLKVTVTSGSRMERVRDMFYVASWLGIRFGDAVRLTKELFSVIDGQLYLVMGTEKTKANVMVPIPAKVKPILEQYDFKFPVITNQEFNQDIKEIGKLAKIEQSVKVINIKRGERISITKAKCDLITTHTARRSFATNLYLRGVKPETIMWATGHKTNKEFMKYLKLSNMEKARELANVIK